MVKPERSTACGYGHNVQAALWGKNCPADTDTQCPQQPGKDGAGLGQPLDRRNEHRLVAGLTVVA